MPRIKGVTGFPHDASDREKISLKTREALQRKGITGKGTSLADPYHQALWKLFVPLGFQPNVKLITHLKDYLETTTRHTPKSFVIDCYHPQLGVAIDIENEWSTPTKYAYLTEWCAAFHKVRQSHFKEDVLSLYKKYRYLKDK